MVSMNSSKFGCNCPKLGCIKSAIFVDLSKEKIVKLKIEYLLEKNSTYNKLTHFLQFNYSIKKKL